MVIKINPDFMKTYRFVAILMFCALVFNLNSYAGDTIALKDAVKKKMVAVMIHGTRPGPKALLSHKYYGQCLQIDVKNLTDSALTLSLETGRILDCDHDSIQNMMITRQLVFTLDGNKSDTYKAYAMCVQETKASPDAHASYQIGDFADKNLLAFSKIIEKYNFQDNAGQNAVWVFTDNNDTTSIYADNMDESRILKKYINKYKYTSAKKIVDPSDMLGEPKVISTKPPTITANMIWEMKKSGNATMQVFDEDNKLVVTVFEKQFFNKGEQTHLVTLSGSNITKGKSYYIRLKIKGSTKEEMTATAE
jgi:hypothetical protein